MFGMIPTLSQRFSRVVIDIEKSIVMPHSDKDIEINDEL
jgi:hypothetical protein